MALLTEMTLDEGTELVAAYGLRLASLHPIAHGSVNSNFRAHLDDGTDVFIRVCEESDSEAVAAQNALLFHLVARGVSTPEPMRRSDGGSVSSHRGKPAVLFPFRPGAWLCQGRVGAAEVHAVGVEVARIDAAGRIDATPRDRFSRADLPARLAALGDVAPEITRDAGRLAELLQRPPPQGDSETVIHGDVFRDNVLWHHNQLSAVLDFESASLGSPQFDLMVTLLAWCFGDDLSQELARALIAGYRSVRPIDVIPALHPQAVQACVRFAITRITDYELRPRGVVVYKDYRRFMARLAAVEEIGAAAFPAWLGL